ncbi:hypothetical protein [Lentiprolixibacter aurantiacus]|uniref:Uncharacterized protein n=1 Tax=Lentiprolixibacter aurantiacus TaxID=2993939 RepID=A0AAE3MIW5_9FLAO|nr:hypothetical protein [Lentiprolixibacter aurantiacus]MCX2718131.1 hypothetical protein [Lentiprolixibacter aurantiacus]
MKRTSYWFIGALIVFCLACYFLVTGSSVLLLSLSESNNIPLGTIITWLGIISIPLLFYFGVRRLRDPITKTERVFSILLKLSICLALLWVPISYLLAGNLSFSFSEKATFQGGQLAMKAFWFNAYFTAAAPVVLGIMFGLISLFQKKPGNQN